ncbi:UNVERIFIED_CONTAM: hypothetical protein NY603_17300, partial [Bacteroidetes bacterium 56_B9]
LAMARENGQRSGEAAALHVLGETSDRDGASEQAEGYYREALALAGQLDMRPLAARCHHGLGRLYLRTGRSSPRSTRHRDGDVPDDGHATLAGAGRGEIEPAAVNSRRRIGLQKSAVQADKASFRLEASCQTETLARQAARGQD